MTRYWIVVKRGNSEIRDILDIAFRGRSAFTIIEDRRGPGRPARRAVERRQGGETLRLHEFFVAERHED